MNQNEPKCAGHSVKNRPVAGLVENRQKLVPTQKTAWPLFYPHLFFSTILIQYFLFETLFYYWSNTHLFLFTILIYYSYNTHLFFINSVIILIYYSTKSVLYTHLFYQNSVLLFVQHPSFFHHKPHNPDLLFNIIGSFHPSFLSEFWSTIPPTPIFFSLLASHS